MASLIPYVFIGIVLIAMWLLLRKVKKLAIRILVIVLAVFLGTGGAVTIKHYVDEGLEKVASYKEAVSSLGSDYVKLDGTKLYVNINGTWCDVAKLKYTEINLYDVSINYDGKDIKLTDSGIVNALKVLIDLGIIKS